MGEKERHNTKTIVEDGIVEVTSVNGAPAEQKSLSVLSLAAAYNGNEQWPILVIRAFAPMVVAMEILCLVASM